MAGTALLPSIFYPNSSPKTLPTTFKLTLPIPNSPKLLLSPLSTSLNHQPLVARTPESFKLFYSPAEVSTLEAEPEETQVVAKKKKRLYVCNWPWTLSAEKLKELFGQCGTVTDVEFIKGTEGKGKYFGFVTMATGEEAQAVLDKFNNSEIEGRTITVEFAKKLKKTRMSETEHKLYVYNLAWKVRGNSLRKFFAQSISPVSSRVIFGERKAPGYGFVSFATREKAEAALSAFDGKELMGRPVRVKFTKKKRDKTESESQGDGNSDTQADTGSESQGEEEIEGRTITVEFAKKLKKTRMSETEHKLDVYNLAWKVRGNNLKKFFAQSISPVTSRVIFGERKAPGYGSVSFATREEAEAALSAFDGKELMGRPVRVKFTKKKGDKTESESQGDGISDTQADTGSDSQGEEEIEGRTITVEFAKKLKKTRMSETEHKLCVYNLAWKVRKNSLRKFFAQSISPVSSRIIFAERKNPYGFVSFATREEAEAALSAFDGKELMGRPVCLKFYEKKGTKLEVRAKGRTKPETQAEGQ